MRKRRGARQRFIVPRISSDEFTFAEVAAEAEQKLTAAALRDALTRALTEWVGTTRKGLQAWGASAGDFNVGDLCGYLLARGALRRILAERGIRRLVGWERCAPVDERDQP